MPPCPRAGSRDETVNFAIGHYFSNADYALALPMLLLALFALGILLIDLMLPKEWKPVNAYIALLGIAFSAAAVGKLHSAYRVAEQRGHDVPAFSGFMGTLLVDRFAIYFFYLFLVGAAIAILMSIHYLEVERENHGEFYALILFSVVGMMCMAAGFDIVLLFIGLELMAISTYVLVGFLRRDKRSNEAALKYLLLGAFSSGFLAYGFSVMYGISGSTKLADIATAIAARGPFDPMVLLALATTSVGLLFKISAVPFHMWAPDAYEGAPTTVTAYLSVASKAASIAFLLRIFLGPLVSAREAWEPILGFVAVATMTVGNLAAINQSNIKRLLAYSSISHAGYMLLGLIAGNATGIKGIAVYVLVYTFMNLGAFLVLVALRRKGILGEDMDDIAGLMHKSPGYALLMLIFLLSLAGIPPTAGFLGKYYIFLSLIETGHYTLAVIGTLYVAVAIYYYFRIVRSMFVRDLTEPAPLATSFGLRVALAVSGILTLGIGLYPEPFLRLAETSLQH